MPASGTNLSPQHATHVLGYEYAARDQLGLETAYKNDCPNQGALATRLSLTSGAIQCLESLWRKVPMLQRKQWQRQRRLYSKGQACNLRQESFPI